MLEKQLAAAGFKINQINQNFLSMCSCIVATGNYDMHSHAGKQYVLISTLTAEPFILTNFNGVFVEEFGLTQSTIN